MFQEQKAGRGLQQNEVSEEQVVQGGGPCSWVRILTNYKKPEVDDKQKNDPKDMYKGGLRLQVRGRGADESLPLLLAAFWLLDMHGDPSKDTLSLDSKETGGRGGGHKKQCHHLPSFSLSLHVRGVVRGATDAKFTGLIPGPILWAKPALLCTQEPTKEMLLLGHSIAQRNSPEKEGPEEEAPERAGLAAAAAQAAGTSPPRAALPALLPRRAAGMGRPREPERAQEPPPPASHSPRA
uniref:Uncharacterized protein n=1 Tax=Rangifer tarandus platyrhynchus TaxID=3082113 RepID=A0ACB0ES18_RANTA|nr:unnamed protein product [Rangifer tarandus platyrhynchus]